MKHPQKIIATLAVCFASLVLAAAPAEAGSISLQWGAVAGATGYRIYHGTSSRTYAEVVDVGNATRWELTQLADCTAHFMAVTAYNGTGESAGYSNEVVGWPRPEITAYDPASTVQGGQYTLNIDGANFQAGAELLFDIVNAPRDFEGNELVHVDSISVPSCNRIQALVTIEPTARGVRAMEVGDFTVEFEVRNPDSVFGARSEGFEVRFDDFRADINRSDAGTEDRVDGKDLVWLSHAYGSRETDPNFNPDADLNGDGEVDGEDLAYLSTGYGGCWNGQRWDPAACL